MRQKGLLHRFLPWEESRLFAVGGKAHHRPEWIELSSAKVLLRWPFTLKDFGILGGPRYAFLAQRLYGYVCLKTKLPLSDLRL